MDPQYLRALMHGELSKDKKPSRERKNSKSKLDSELDKEIDDFVDAHEFEENHNGLENPKLRRERMRSEIKEAMKLPELSELVGCAIKILFSDGARYLSEDANHLLISNLMPLTASTDELGIQDVSDQSLQSLFKISDDSMRAIVEIALAKFEEENYHDAMALFYFLSILNPAYSEYWFRLGIAAQKNENFDLASRAYSATILLNPENIGARLFAAECFVQRNLYDEAKSEVEFVKNMASKTKIDQVWLNILSNIEGSIQAKY